MKYVLKNSLIRITVLAFITLLGAVVMNSCTAESPFSPDSDSQQQVTAFDDVNNEVDDFHFVSWNPVTEGSTRSLSKTYTVRKYIRKSHGGVVSIYANSGDSDDLEDDGHTKDKLVAASLSVPSGAIDHSKTITMSLDDNKIEFEFGPSGTQFSPGAKLSFYAEGLNLAGLQNDQIGIYYLSGDGEVIPVPAEQIVVDEHNGKIMVRNAEINHFSRYALGHD